MFGSWLTDATVSKTLVWLLASAFNAIKTEACKSTTSRYDIKPVR